MLHHVHRIDRRAVVAYRPSNRNIDRVSDRQYRRVIRIEFAIARETMMKRELIKLTFRNSWRFSRINNRILSLSCVLNIVHNAPACFQLLMTRCKSFESIPSICKCFSNSTNINQSSDEKHLLCFIISSSSSSLVGTVTLMRTLTASLISKCKFVVDSVGASSIPSNRMNVFEIQTYTNHMRCTFSVRDRVECNATAVCWLNWIDQLMHAGAHVEH